MAFKLCRAIGIAAVAATAGGCGVKSPLSSFLPQASENRATPSQADVQAKFGSLSRDGAEQRQRAIGEIERSR